MNFIKGINITPKLDYACCDVWFLCFDLSLVILFEHKHSIKFVNII